MHLLAPKTQPSHIQEGTAMERSETPRGQTQNIKYFPA